MRLLNKAKNRIWVTLAGILIVSLILVLAAIVPVLEQIKTLRAELDDSEQAISEAELAVANYQAAVEEFERIGESREKITQMFPVRSEMVVLVQELENAAARAGASLELELTDELENPPPVVVGDPTAGVRVPVVAGLINIEEVPYTLTLGSNYRGLIRFFMAMENLYFNSEIINISVTADTIQNDATKTLINTGSGTSKIEGVLFIRK